MAAGLIRGRGLIYRQAAAPQTPWTWPLGPARELAARSPGRDPATKPQGAGPAPAWWQYTELGAEPCAAHDVEHGPTHSLPAERAFVRDAAGWPPAFLHGREPGHGGITGSASFGFDATKARVQTVVLFLTSDIGQVTGEPVAEAPAGCVGKDTRRSTTITATPVAGGATMIYRPTGSLILGR